MAPPATAKVRPQITGLVLQRRFKEGSDVKAGQALFRIDAAPYQATLQSARAGLARAEANLAQASALAARYKPLVAENVSHQILDGNRSIIGIMLESHLVEGNQNAEQPREQMCYGQSITDACINWESTETLLRRMAAELKDALPKRLA